MSGVIGMWAGAAKKLRYLLAVLASAAVKTWSPLPRGDLSVVEYRVYSWPGEVLLEGAGSAALPSLLPSGENIAGNWNDTMPFPGIDDAEGMSIAFFIKGAWLPENAPPTYSAEEIELLRLYTSVSVSYEPNVAFPSMGYPIQFNLYPGKTTDQLQLLLYTAAGGSASSDTFYTLYTPTSYIVYTQTGSNAWCLYINGVLAGTGTGVYPFLYNSGFPRMRYSPRSGAYTPSGFYPTTQSNLQYLSVWNRPLTSTEVWNLWQAAQ